jgi:hypothetical protein
MIAVLAPLAALSAAFRPETAIMRTLGPNAPSTPTDPTTQRTAGHRAAKRRPIGTHGAMSHSDGPW